MEIPVNRPKIETITRHLSDLEQVGRVAQRVLESASEESYEQTIEALIYRGYSDLLATFNGVSLHDPHIESMPQARQLKMLLGGTPLPILGSLGAKDTARGLKNAHSRMIDGQNIKQRRSVGEEVSKTEVDNAIGAPSVNTSETALAVGTSGHIIERIIMARLKRDGIDTDTWVKDTVLWALEDISLVDHAKAVTYGTEDSELFEYFSTPPDPINGGMGWRSAEQVETVIEHYQAVEKALKNELMIRFLEITGEEFDCDFSATPLVDLQGDMHTFLILNDQEELADQLSQE